MDAADVAGALRRRWLVAVAIFVLALGAAATWFFLQPRQYTAAAEVYVSTSTADSADADVAYQLSLLARERMATYAALADSPQVLDPVRRVLGLPESVTELGKRVRATNPPGTILLTVSATAATPRAAADLANESAKYLVTTIQDLEGGDGGQAPLRVVVTTPAAAPEAPSSPSRSAALAVGLLLGVVGGLGGALLVDRLDNAIRSEDDLSELCGARPLGMIQRTKKPTDSYVATKDYQGNSWEGFRDIRTNLRFAAVDDPPRVIALTSANAAEGKTTVAIKLALVIAQTGAKVCLIDLDLRRPQLAERLGLDSGIGVTDVVSGTAQLADALLDWQRGRLAVLPSGSPAPNPSELLSSIHMRDLIGALRDQFEIVIVDTAPVLPVADGSIAAAACDGAILIVQAGETTRADVARAVDRIEQAGGHLIGTVLNGVPGRDLAYGYGYGYPARPSRV